MINAYIIIHNYFFSFYLFIVNWGGEGCNQFSKTLPIYIHTYIGIFTLDGLNFPNFSLNIIKYWYINKFLKIN